MARILGMCGFEGQEIAYDGMVRTSGSAPVPLYPTTLPVASKSARSFNISNAGYSRLWHDGATITGTPREPTSGRYAFGFQWYPGGNTTSNDQCIIGVGIDGLESVTLSRQDTTGYLTLRVGGAVVVTSTTPLTVTEFNRVIVDVVQASSVKVYLDGDLSVPIINHTLGSALSAPNGFIFAGPSTPANYIDDMWAVEVEGSDPANILRRYISVSIEPITLTGAGPDAEWGDGLGGTGLYSAIDERPPSDIDLIDATDVDLVSTFTHDSVSDDLLYAVQWMMRVTRSGTDGGENLHVRMDNGADTVDLPLAGAAAAPGDGNVIIMGDLDPESNDWTPARLTATRVGPVSRT